MALRGIPSIAPHRAIGRPTGATNLVTNGGFETNTTGWLALGGTGAIARITTDPKFGSACCEVTCGATNDGIQGSGAFTVSAATQYTASAYIKSPAGETITFQWNEYTGGGFTAANSANLAGNGQWQRIPVTATTGAGVDGVILFAYSASGAVTFQIDGIQFETGPIATPYIETNGGSASRSPLLVVAP